MTENEITVIIIGAFFVFTVHAFIVEGLLAKILAELRKAARAGSRGNHDNT